MAQQDIIPGSKFRLLRQNDSTPSQYDFLCMATSKSLDRKTDFEDATFPDCDNPDALAKRRSSPKSQSWDAKFSGKADALRFAKLEADYDSGVTHSYQLLIALTSAKGGRTYTGAAYVESLTISSQDNGMVAFECSLRGDGILVSAAVA